jgi:hypothetical protein
MAFTTTFALVSIVLVKLHIRIKHGTVSTNLTEVCKPDSGIVDIALIGNQDNASSVSNIPHPPAMEEGIGLHLESRYGLPAAP